MDGKKRWQDVYVDLGLFLRRGVTEALGFPRTYKWVEGHSWGEPGKELEEIKLV